MCIRDSARTVFEEDIIPIIKPCIFEALNNEKDAIEAVIATIKLVTQRNAPTLFSENIEQRVRSLRQKTEKDVYKRQV